MDRKILKLLIDILKIKLRDILFEEPRISSVNIFSTTKGAYHLTEKSGWGVKSIMVSDLPQKCHIRYGLNPKKGRTCVA